MRQDLSDIRALQHNPREQLLGCRTLCTQSTQRTWLPDESSLLSRCTFFHHLRGPYIFPHTRVHRVVSYGRAIMKGGLDLGVQSIQSLWKHVFMGSWLSQSEYDLAGSFD